MRDHVIIIPADRFMSVDGVPLWFDYTAPATLHALQWHKGAGHQEWTDAANTALTEADYTLTVEPYVRLYETEYARLVEEANAPPTLEKAKDAKLTEINAACDAILQTLTSTYPASELLTFDKQETEARAYLADSSTTPTPLLTALAAGRGITLADLAGRVMAKADAFAAASGYVIGQRQGLEDQLDAAQTVEAVRAIAVNITLPEDAAA